MMDHKGHPRFPCVNGVFDVNPRNRRSVAGKGGLMNVHILTQKYLYMKGLAGKFCFVLCFSFGFSRQGFSVALADLKLVQ